MDGVPIERWIEAASTYVADGSGALVRRRSARLLRYVNLVRDELGLEHNNEVKLLLRGPGGDTTEVRVPLAERRAIYGIWPPVPSAARRHGFVTQRLPGNVAYVRLITMGDEEDAAELREAIEDMRDSHGFIIDVRDNGGGSRAPIPPLLSLFMRDEARVVNVAARRLPRVEPRPAEGWLADRYAYPITWTGWTDAERVAIDRTMSDFKPQWTPPKELFSDWHVMVVSRKPGEPQCDGPLVILMNEGCFSATDILLGAFKGAEGVTLLGTPSSGGSARSSSHRIEALQASARLATMASFQPNGRLYDTNGIQPDILIEPTVDDLLGRGDSQLDAALSHISELKQH